MTTPADLEERATRLRHIAADLRREATKVSGLLDPVKDLHNELTWQGPVALEFTGTLMQWKSWATSALDAILDAAASFERDADKLDTEASDERRKARKKESETREV